MKKYRISLESRVLQFVELFAEDEEQADEFAERIAQIQADFLESEAPDSKSLIFCHSSFDEADDWEVGYNVEELN